MASSSQSTFVGQAKTVQSLWNELLQWYNGVKNVNTLISKGGAQNAWKAMATAVSNADGSLGTADGSPNETHVITVSSLDSSADDLINALNNMLTVCSVIDGTGGVALNASIDHRGDAPSVTTLVG